jgi:putative flippase GtrA
MRRLFHRHTRLIRFLAIGLLNSAVGYGLFALFIYLGFHYAFASLVATTLGVCFNFFSTGKLVFKQLGKTQAVRFTLVYVFLYGLNLLFLALLLKVGITEYVGGFLLIPVMAAFAYVLHARFTFRSIKPPASIT